MSRRISGGKSAMDRRWRSEVRSRWGQRRRSAAGSAWERAVSSRGGEQRRDRCGRWARRVRRFRCWLVGAGGGRKSAAGIIGWTRRRRSALEMSCGMSAGWRDEISAGMTDGTWRRESGARRSVGSAKECAMEGTVGSEPGIKRWAQSWAGAESAELEMSGRLSGGNKRSG